MYQPNTEAIFMLLFTGVILSIESKPNHHNSQPPFLLATGISSIRRLHGTQGHWNSSCIIRHIPQQGINAFALRVLCNIEAGRDLARIRFHHHPCSIEDETCSSLIRPILRREAHFMARRRRTGDVKHLVGPAGVRIGGSVRVGDPSAIRGLRCTFD